MTYRQAIFLAAAAIGVAAVTSIVVGRARQPNRKPTSAAARQAAVAGTTSNRPAAHRANRPTDPAGRLPSVLIRDVPHEHQKPDFCGEACAAMILRKLGRPVDQDYVFDCSGLDPLKARGCYTRELAAALKKIGFKAGPVWYKLKTAKSAEQLEAQWRSLHADLVDGVASIVCMHFDQRPGATEHFRLVLGYDAGRDEIIYHEPATADGAYRRMARATFLKLWPLKYATDTWTLVRIPLRPGWTGATGVSPVPGGQSHGQDARGTQCR